MSPYKKGRGRQKTRLKRCGRKLGWRNEVDLENRNSKCERDSTHHCWLSTSRGPGAKECRSPLKPENGPWRTKASKKTGIELSPANNLVDLEADSLPYPPE